MKKTFTLKEVKELFAAFVWAQYQDRPEYPESTIKSIVAWQWEKMEKKIKPKRKS